MRISKVYTRTGDTGETGLVSGQRVRKDHVRVEAFGTVDELSAQLGMVRAELGRDAIVKTPAGRLADQQFEYLQHRLFDLGGRLATPPDARNEYTPDLGETEIGWLESVIDGYNDDLPPLKEFILPGGSPLVASLHITRCVARRAERRVLSLHCEEQGDEDAVKWLNRLSDLLFVMCRWAAAASDVTEYSWRRDLTKPPARVD